MPEIPNIQRAAKPQPYKRTGFLLFKAFVGSGILALPYSFQQGGYILSIIVFLLIGSLINYAQLQFVQIANHYPDQLDYCTLIEKSLGLTWRKVGLGFTLLMQYGCCISYMIFFIQFIDLALYNSTDPNLMHSILYLLLALTVIIPLSFIQDVSLFAKTNNIANILIAISLSALSIDAMSNINNHVHNNELQAFRFENMSTLIGVSIYAFEAVCMLLNVKHSMEGKSRFPRLLQIVTFAVIILNITFSEVCAFGYGNTTQQIILFNLGTNKLNALFQVGYAVALIMTFPLQLFPAFQLIEESDIVKNRSNVDKKIIRVTQVLWIGFIALFIPEFSVFLSLVGGFAGTSLQFLFPMLIHWKIKPQNNIFNCLMGLGCALGLYATINSIIIIITIAADYDTPIIGILTEPSDYANYPETTYSYLAASYVKFAESGGARVIPIPYEASNEKLELYFQRINGLLIPGGSLDFDTVTGSKFVSAVAYLLERAIQENISGNVFPILAICLGHQTLHHILSGNQDILFRVYDELATNHALENVDRSATLYNTLSDDLFKKLTTDTVVYYNHNWAVSPSAYVKYPSLAKFFKITSYNRDSRGQQFIGSTEAREYPILTIQYHPEKINFEWKIPSNHSYEAVLITQHHGDVFIDLSRKSQHRCSDPKPYLIYNYNPIQEPSASFVQIYIFKLGQLQ